MQVAEIMHRLERQANPVNVAGMARFGIKPGQALGIAMPELRLLAKQIGRDHDLAQGLWATGIHEARILAGLIDDPCQVSADQMEAWVLGFDSWDVCDQCCLNLFDKTAHAYAKARAWAVRDEEFVRRAGFALMAVLAVHDKKADSAVFSAMLPLIRQAAHDERNFVKKAVNWALRQIGKRGGSLYGQAVALAEELRQSDSKAARWIGADALRELQGAQVLARLQSIKNSAKL